jgi:flagellar hook-associated protein 2
MGSGITFTGLSSGLDTQAIVEKLMEIERQPVVRFQEQQALIGQKLDLFQDIAAKLNSLNSSIATLNSQTDLSAKALTSSDNAAITGSATSYAANGSYTISEITNLATAHSESFIGVQDQTAEFEAGTYFNFEVDGTSYSIDLTAMDADEKNLEGLRDAINAEAGDDVNAFIMNTGADDDPYKLVIQSLETGEDNRIINVSTDIDVTTSGGTADFDTVVSEQVLGSDASFVFNGVTITRSTNSVDDLIEGITFNLKKETTDPVTITVANDTESVKSDIEDFISKYNDLNAIIQEQFDLDSETGEAGLLAGDTTLRQIQSAMHTAVIKGVTDSDGNRYSLASVGVEFDKETGDLSLDTEKFEEALASSDGDLIFDVFTTRGVPSSSDVRYVSSSNDTQEGTYGITITGEDGNGNIEGYFTFDGTNYIGIGSGNYLTGPDGSPMEGLKIGITEGVTGDLGTIHFSVGVAGKLTRNIDGYIRPLTGLLPKLEDRLEADIAELTVQIENFEARLVDRERVLTNQFLAAEEAISALQSQQSAFAAQLANLS